MALGMDGSAIQAALTQGLKARKKEKPYSARSGTFMPAAAVAKESWGDIAEDEDDSDADLFLTARSEEKRDAAASVPPPAPRPAPPAAAMDGLFEFSRGGGGPAPPSAPAPEVLSKRSGGREAAESMKMDFGTPAGTPARAVSKSEALNTLLMDQAASGQWGAGGVITAALSNLVISHEAPPATTPAQWYTALAVAILEHFYDAEKSLWFAMARKAKRWLNSQAGKEAAKAMLESAASRVVKV